MDRRDIKQTQIGLMGVIVLWLVSSVVVSTLGLFDQPGTPPIFLGLFLAGPITGFVLAYALSRRIREALLAVPLWVVTAVHSFRIVPGVFFVVGALNHTLAPKLGWEAGLGDITVAIFSIPLAIWLRQGRRGPALTTGYVTWNLFGLTDLFNAVVLGLLYAPGTLGLLAAPGVNSQALLHFPWTLVPTFYVPMCILLHFLALRRVRAGELARGSGSLREHSPLSTSLLPSPDAQVSRSDADTSARVGGRGFWTKRRSVTSSA